MAMRAALKGLHSGTKILQIAADLVFAHDAFLPCAKAAGQGRDARAQSTLCGARFTIK